MSAMFVPPQSSDARLVTTGWPGRRPPGTGIVEGRRPVFDGLVVEERRGKG